jgi:hypothetical protein
VPKPIEVDIWRAANLLIEQHGADAELEAAQRADELLEKGDPDGFHAWANITKVIRQLLAPRKAVH